MGIPYINSQGEAEAMCALLNQNGVSLILLITILCYDKLFSLSLIDG